MTNKEVKDIVKIVDDSIYENTYVQKFLKNYDVFSFELVSEMSINVNGEKIKFDFFFGILRKDENMKGTVKEMCQTKINMKNVKGYVIDKTFEGIPFIYFSQTNLIYIEEILIKTGITYIKEKMNKVKNKW